MGNREQQDALWGAVEAASVEFHLAQERFDAVVQDSLRAALGNADGIARIQIAGIHRRMAFEKYMDALKAMTEHFSKSRADSA